MQTAFSIRWSTKDQGLLTGLLHCRCGHAAGCDGRRGARGRYRYYCCSGACGAGRIPREELDRAVTSALLNRLSGRPLLTRLAATWEQERRKARSAVAACERELARLAAAAEKLRRWRLEERIGPEEYRALQASLAARRHACEQRRAEGAARLERVPAVTGLRRWDLLLPDQRKRVLAQFVERVTAWRDRQTGALELEICWRLPKRLQQE